MSKRKGTSAKSSRASTSATAKATRQQLTRQKAQYLAQQQARQQAQQQSDELEGRPRRAPSRTRLGLAWFPAEEYPAALARWPELAEPGGPAAGGRSHSEYNRAVQAHLVDLRSSTTAQADHVDLVVVPVHLAAFDTWFATNAQDPATSAARAAYAAEQARTSPDVIAWPPALGQDCWCGTALPYTSCCATTC